MVDESQEDIQQIVGELREAQQNIEVLQSQKEVIQNSINEIESTKETLEGIEDVEPGTELLVPIGSGSYLPVEVQNPDRILSELGADLVAERPPEEVSKLIDKQKNDLEDSLETTEDKIEELTDKIEELRPKAQEMIAKSRSENE